MYVLFNIINVIYIGNVYRILNLFVVLILNISRYRYSMVENDDMAAIFSTSDFDAAVLNKNTAGTINKYVNSIKSLKAYLKSQKLNNCLDETQGTGKDAAIFQIVLPLTNEIIKSYINNYMIYQTGAKRGLFKKHDTVDGAICAVKYLYHRRKIPFDKALEIELKDFNKGK